MGRKGILEYYPEKAELFLKVLRAGNYASVACRYAGFSTSSLHLWLNQGEEDQAAGKETVYSEFLEAYEKADSHAEIKAVAQVTAAGDETWQAAATYLERRHPERWSRRERHEVTGKDGEAVKVEHGISADTVAATIAILDSVGARRPGGSDPGGDPALDEVHPPHPEPEAIGVPGPE